MALRSSTSGRPSLQFWTSIEVNIVSRRSTRRYVIKPVETKSGRNRRGNRLDPGSLEETFERICFRYIHSKQLFDCNWRNDGRDRWWRIIQILKHIFIAVCKRIKYYLKQESRNILLNLLIRNLINRITRNSILNFLYSLWSIGLRSVCMHLIWIWAKC